MAKRWVSGAAAVGVLLGSTFSSPSASAGIPVDESWVFSIYDGGWTDWASIWDPGDGLIFDPGETPTALLILIPGIPFVDLVDFGCVETPRTQGDEFDFSFVIDANACLDIEPASTVETMVDDDYFPVAAILWAAIEDGQAVEFECLDVQGDVSTGGDIDAVIDFRSDPLVLGGSTGTLSEAGTMDDFVASMSSIGSERTELFDVALVGALLLADEAGPLDDVDPDADAVWTVDMEFSPCSGGGRLPGLDIDHYRSRAEQGVLPNTD